MAILKTPVMQWPFKMNGNASAFLFTEQSYLPEIEQCVGFVLATQPGQLIDDPELGLRNALFVQGGVTINQIEEAVHEFEPRAKLTISQNRLIELIQTVNIEVGSEG